MDKPDDSEARYVAVLEIPPAVSPATAVRVSIVSDIKKSFPMRKYFLDSTGGLDEDSYYLVFEDNGNMVVHVVRDFEQPYKNDTLSVIEPIDFDRIQVNGQPLRKLVIAKLEAVLAQPPPSKSCI